MRNLLVISVAVAVCLTGSTGRSAVKLSPLFSDNMVLQRNQPIAVWGDAAPHETVKVALADVEATTQADAMGAWRVALPARDQAVDLTLTVSGENTLAFNNVAVGDVWFCSGQSNMEMALGGCRAPEDVAGADFALIRFLRVPRVVATTRCTVPPESMGAWRSCSPQTAASMTAAGFYFAREIHTQTGVPIGIIDASWSGSRIEPYIAEEGVKTVPEVIQVKAPFEQAQATYRQMLEKSLEVLERWIAETRTALADGKPLPMAPAQPADPAANPQQWHAKFNAMIAPFISYPVRGILWYQGCSNGSEGTPYLHKTAALVNGWRYLWGNTTLPFYAVQLANYTPDRNTPTGADGYAHLRMAQLEAFRLLPHSGLAVIIDVGETGDIHPKNKFDVGMRLARWALHNDYGKTELVPSGPLYKGMAVQERVIRLSFDYVGKGLMVGKKQGRAPAVADSEGKLSRFAIAGEDRTWYWADAVIDGDTVAVSSPQVAAPVAVRYAFSANPLGANLYNTDGLPASPFRTDTW